MLHSKIVPWLTPLLFCAVSARFEERQAHNRPDRLAGEGHQVKPRRPGGDFREHRSGAGRCEQNSDCRKSAPHCSKWGFCQWSAQFGSRPLDLNLDPDNQPTDTFPPLNKHFTDNSEYILSEEYADYEDYFSEFGDDYEHSEDFSVVKRNFPPVFEENLDVVSIPQRFIAPQLATEGFKSDSSLDQPSSSLDPMTETKVLDFPYFLAEPRRGLEREPRLPVVLLPPPVHLPLKVTPTTRDQNRRNNQDISDRDQLTVDQGDRILVPINKKEPDMVTNCPGGSIKECVFACVPLPDLHVYSLCVHECADRCPQSASS